MTFYRVLTGSDTNPSVSLPSAWQGSAAGASGHIAVWSGVHTTTPFDAFRPRNFYPELLELLVGPAQPTDLRR